MHGLRCIPASISGFLGGYYLTLAVMNGVAAYYHVALQAQEPSRPLIWTAFAWPLMVHLSVRWP